MLCTGLAGVIRCLYEALEGVTKTPVCLSRCLHSVSNNQQPTSPPTATHRQPSPNTQSSPRSTSPRHGKRVAKRPTFLPVSRNCLCPPDPRLCYSVPKSIPVSQPAARCVLSSATHSQRRPLASLTAPISWPAGATEKHLLLGSATPFPAFYNPLLRQGPALRFWYLHTTAIRAPALRFRILPVSAKTPT